VHTTFDPAKDAVNIAKHGVSLAEAAWLAACRTLGVESENRPQRGRFLPDLQAHSPAMGQKDGEKWTAAVDLQPTIPKSDRLLDWDNAQVASDERHAYGELRQVALAPMKGR